MLLILRSSARSSGWRRSDPADVITEDDIGGARRPLIDQELCGESSGIWTLLGRVRQFTSGFDRREPSRSPNGVAE
jgi:hypothetical protein